MTTEKSRTKNDQKKQSKAQRGALGVLEQDHRKVESLFRSFERLEEDDHEEKTELVGQICSALSVHAEVEEEVFYPTVRKAFAEAEEGEDLLDEAEVEHDSITALVEDLEDMDSQDALFDAKVKVLSEYVKHHVKEEEDELFPKAKKLAGLDLEEELGRRIEERKAELEEERGLGSGEDEESAATERDDEAEDADAGDEPRNAGRTTAAKRTP